MCATASICISIEAAIIPYSMEAMGIMLAISIILGVAQTSYADKANKAEIDDLKKKIESLEANV